MKSTPIASESLFTLRDLGIAYRKVKADLFYGSRICRQEIQEFELDLRNNLIQLDRKIHSGSIRSIKGECWSLIPKGRIETSSRTGLIHSDPAQRWKLSQDSSSLFELRIMEALPIEFHIFATLWIHKVGHKFDAAIGKVAYGNRLRRSRSNDLDLQSLGSTSSYKYAYRKWRDDGITAASEALEAGKEVVVVTADVSSFYHSLDPSFMKSKELQRILEIELSDDERELNDLFIESIIEWSSGTPLKMGLPVGLVASAVIANVALFELDKIFESEIVPIHYGRYVDDIILVIENTKHLGNENEVWGWLRRHSKGILREAGNDDSSETIAVLNHSHLRESRIEFKNQKNKVFVLTGETGMALLSSVQQTIRERTSEWQSLPEIQDEVIDIESGISKAIQRDGDFADSLHFTEAMSLQRANIALKLRNIESYNRLLSQKAWKKKRTAFLEAFTRQIITLPSFMEFYNYIPRVIEIATSCGDFKQLRSILDAVNRVVHDLKGCKLEIAAMDGNILRREGYVFGKFKANIVNEIKQSVEGSFPLRLSVSQHGDWLQYFGDGHPLLIVRETKTLQDEQKIAFGLDLAFKPMKLILPTEMLSPYRPSVAKRKLPKISRDAAIELLGDNVVSGVETLSRITRTRSTTGLPSALLFPTRPPDIRDLYLLHSNPYSTKGRREIASAMLAMQANVQEAQLPTSTSGKKNTPIEIPWIGSTNKEKIRIAVVSWETDDNSWIAAATKNSDPDTSRIDRLFTLINSVIHSRKTPDYLIMPELSLPPDWFVAVATRLQKRRISFICGVEYIHSRRRVVRNQVWLALSHKNLGYPGWMIYRQDKQRPAQGEERNLFLHGGRVLKPRCKWKTPPIIKHGDFYFSVLVCSELTNIEYRSALRGRIDALFVPEWNQDTDSYRPLIESAALDIHAYIVQCNHRKYGDSCIRVPHKNSWERDMVRVKGGLEDYFVTGEIDIWALRSFQSNYRSPEEPYKPVPDGFEISYPRRTLPSK